MFLSLGGLKGSWLVARRRASWRERLLGFESRVALLWEALSLIRPMISLSFVVCPIEREREVCLLVGLIMKIGCWI